MVMPFSEESQSCLNKVRPRTITKSGFQDVEHGKERPASERAFFRRGGGGAVAVRFHLHVLDKHAISHGIPYHVGPAVGVPGEHDGNIAEIPRRGIVADTDIRATSEEVWAEAGSKHGDAVFRGQPELFEQGQAPDDHEIGFSGRRAWQGTPRVRA